MGYRSDVMYVIKFHTIEKRDNFVTLMLAKNDPVTTQALDECEHRYKDDPLISFHMEDIKWYTSFAEIRIHHSLMEQAEELYNAGWRFVRIGEETGDIEQEEHGEMDLWEYMEARSYINANLPRIEEQTNV